jgi:hypothetical protein
VAGEVGGSDGRRPAGTRDAVQEHPLALGPHGADGVDGVLDHEGQVRVHPLVRLVDEPDLVVLELGGNLAGPDPTQRDDGVDLGDGVGERGEVAEQHPVVARQGREEVGVAVPLDLGCGGPAERGGSPSPCGEDREAGEVARPQPGPAVQHPTPRERDRGGAPPCAEHHPGDRRDGVGVVADPHGLDERVLEVLGRVPGRGSGSA